MMFSATLAMRKRGSLFYLGLKVVSVSRRGENLLERSRRMVGAKKIVENKKSAMPIYTPKDCPGFELLLLAPAACVSRQPNFESTKTSQASG